MSIGQYSSINAEEVENLEEHLIKLVRTTKVVKGGRRFRFAAFMVVGNQNGVVGIGYGKANEIPEAIRKAVDRAKKTLIKVSLKNGTIPHEVQGKYCASRVWLKSASPGTGVIAGGNIRSLLEYAGIHNILSKSFNSRNTINATKAAFECLKSLVDVKELAEKRDKKIKEVFQ